LQYNRNFFSVLYHLGIFIVFFFALAKEVCISYQNTCAMRFLKAC